MSDAVKTPEQIEAEQQQAALSALHQPDPVDESAKAKAEADRVADDEARAKAEADAKATEEAARPAPGTPDKVLQTMQQDLSAAQRKVDELAAKISAGEALSQREQQQVVQQKRKLDELREKLAAKSGVAIDDEPLMADALGEIDSTVASLAKENQSLKAAVTQLQQHAQQTADQAAWSAVEKQYPGVQHRDVWHKCVEEAVITLGEDASPNAAQRLASRWFHERCDMAVKSIAAKKPAASTPAPRGTTKVAAEVSDTPANAPLTDDEKYLKAAHALVV